MCVTLTARFAKRLQWYFLHFVYKSLQGRVAGAIAACLCTASMRACVDKRACSITEVCTEVLQEQKHQYGTHRSIASSEVSLKVSAATEGE